MRTRDLNNKIHILETVKDEFSISDKVDFIRKRFDEYNTFIGDHIGKMNIFSLSLFLMYLTLSLTLLIFSSNIMTY